MEGFGYACAVLLAGVFVRAGAAKVARPAATAASFAALGVPGAATVGRVVPFAELLVAVVLLGAPRAGAVVAVALLTAFTVVVVRAVRSGLRTPCNCLGTARADPVSWLDVERNGLLGVLALLSLVPPHPLVPTPTAVLAAGAVFACGAGVLRASRGR